MHRVTLDQPLLSQLSSSIDAQVELCDPSGRTLGYFLPADLHDRLWYEWAKTQFTDEELEHARQQSGGRTTVEVLERLKRL